MDGQHPSSRVSGAAEATSEALHRHRRGSAAEQFQLHRMGIGDTTSAAVQLVCGESDACQPTRDYAATSLGTRPPSPRLLGSALSSYLLSERCSYRGDRLRAHVCAGETRWSPSDGGRAGEQLPNKPPHQHRPRIRSVSAGRTAGQSASAPGRIRTRDPLLRRQLLCPAELRAPEGNCARPRSHDGYARVAVCRACGARGTPARNGPAGRGNFSKRQSLPEPGVSQKAFRVCAPGRRISAITRYLTKGEPRTQRAL